MMQWAGPCAFSCACGAIVVECSALKEYSRHTRCMRCSYAIPHTRKKHADLLGDALARTTIPIEASNPASQPD